ncbi:MAG: response regulator [Candidatus Margulisiibacteriota bacterium]
MTKACAARPPMLVGLLGGEATRCRPVTAGRQDITPESQKKPGIRLGGQTYSGNPIPKQLFPLAGTALCYPLFSRVITDCGVSEIALAVKYRVGDIRRYFDSKINGIKYWDHQNISGENLNTAGCVVKGWQESCKPRNDAPDTFLILSGDIRSGANVARMLELHREQNALVSIVLAPVPWNKLDRFGVCFKQGASFNETKVGKHVLKRQDPNSGGKYAPITLFVEKAQQESLLPYQSNLNNASIYIVSARLLSLIEDDVEVAKNMNQLDPELFKGKTIATEMKKYNPYGLHIPNLEDENIPFDKKRGNYVNDYTDPSGKHWRLGVFSTRLLKEIKGKEIGEKARRADEANVKFQDWGGHIFPEVAQHHPEIYKRTEKTDPAGFFGYVSNQLWADDGTRRALLDANGEFLKEAGGFDGHRFDFWPRPAFRHDANGNKIWYEEGVTVEDDQSIVGPAYLGRGVVVKRGARVEGSVVGAGWTLPTGTEVIDSCLAPDRTLLGLEPEQIGLHYALLGGMRLGQSLVGGGFVMRDGALHLIEDHHGKYEDQELFRAGGGVRSFIGKILVSNEEGTFVVPLDPPGEPKNKTAIPESTEAVLAKLRAFLQVEDRIAAGLKVSSNILIVDDNTIFLDLIKSALEEDGWRQIDTAKNAIEATEKLKTRRYDYVILDSILSARNGRDATGGIKLLKSLITNPDSPTNFGTPALLWSSQASLEASRGLTLFDAPRLEDRNIQVRKKEELRETAALSRLIIDGIIKSK